MHVQRIETKELVIRRQREVLVRDRLAVLAHCLTLDLRYLGQLIRLGVVDVLVKENKIPESDMSAAKDMSDSLCLLQVSYELFWRVRVSERCLPVLDVEAEMVLDR